MWASLHGKRPFEQTCTNGSWRPKAIPMWTLRKEFYKKHLSNCTCFGSSWGKETLRMWYMPSRIQSESSFKGDLFLLCHEKNSKKLANYHFCKLADMETNFRSLYWNDLIFVINSLEKFKIDRRSTGFFLLFFDSWQN